ncbi:hypothetical protein GF324_00530 [bacterium]|nr:hypothetical protein [bacterium]
MPDLFVEHLEQLPRVDTERLMAAPTVLLSMISLADNWASTREMLALTESFGTFYTELSPDLMDFYKKHRELYDDGVDHARERMRDDLQVYSTAVEYSEETGELRARPSVEQELNEMRRVIDELPADYPTRYRDMLKRAMLRTAEASGSFLGFGKAINDDERLMLKLIADRLDIPLDESEFA